MDDGGSQRVAEVLHPPPHRPPVERLTLPLQVLLQAVVRHAERELLDGDVSVQ
jgi:hypothetical protein